MKIEDAINEYVCPCCKTREKRLVKGKRHKYCYSCENRIAEKEQTTLFDNFENLEKERTIKKRENFINNTNIDELDNIDLI